MKKALLTVAILAAAISVQAQNIRLGLCGGINSTWLMNKNVFDANDELDIAASFGGRLGVEGIYSFSEKVGLSVGINFISTNNQKYTGDNGQNYSYDYKAKLNYIDVPILFRLTSSSGTYFELGPQFGFLGTVKETYESSPSNIFNYSDADFKNQYNTTNIAVILGFGVDIDVTENIYITTGLRLGYGISDVTKEYGSHDEVDAQIPLELGPTYWAHFEDANTGSGHNLQYEKTSRVFGGLNLGVSYKFGGK